MDLETRPKIDPDRPQKVFTAGQIAEAFIAAGNEFHSVMIEQGMPESLASIAMSSTVAPLWTLVQHQLGIEGKDGAYLDADTPEDSGRGR